MSTDTSLNLPSPAPPETAMAEGSTWLWRFRWYLTAAGLAVLAFIGFLVFGGSKSKAPSVRPVPVLTALAVKGDMPVKLTGLGTVTPLNTVTVRSRVDGQLIRLAFQEGQPVREGELLAEIDPRPFQVQLMQAEGQRAKDQAALTNALADQRRLQSLVQQGIISRQQVDTQDATVAQYEAALKSDQAQVESAKLNLTYSRITAPISGRVGLRQVDPGNMIRANDANGLVVITPVQPINVLFTIPADAIQPVLAQIRKGAKLQAKAYDRDMRTCLATGFVVAIDNQVDPSTGTVRIKALYNNEDGALFPNQFVNVRLLVDTLKDCIIVPTAALQRSPQGMYLYVAQPDGTADMRTVQVLGTEGDNTAIKDGVVPGEAVVTDGIEKLRPGSKISLPKAEGQGGRNKGGNQ